MLEPQRPYRKIRADVRALPFRHSAAGRIDATVSRERIARPFGSAPRTVKGWQ